VEVPSLQSDEVISILVTAMVFLLLSAGLFGMFRRLLRGLARRKAIGLWVGLDLLALGVSSLGGLAVLQITGLEGGSADLTKVWILLGDFAAFSGGLVIVGWVVANVISDLRKDHATGSQAVSTYSIMLTGLAIAITTATETVVGNGWYLLPVGVVDLVLVLWSTIVAWRFLHPR
jgi:hypothetical protein